MSLERNITLFYVIGSLLWMRFFLPVLALFYIASQVTLQEFTIIMAVFALAILLFEIPSGVLSDLLGRKKTLLISRSMYIIEVAMLAFMDGFWLFLIAKIVSGIGVSLSSGTKESLLYETLQKLKREKEHSKIYGKSEMYSSISMAFAFILGAYLFTLDPKLPAKLTLIPTTLGFGLTFLLVEPYVYKHKLTLKNSWNHMIQGFKYFFQHKKIISISLFSIPIAAALTITLSMSSDYFKAVSIPIVFIGGIAFVISMTTAYASKKAHIIEESLGEKKFISLTQFIILLGVGLMTFMIPFYGAIFYLLIGAVYGLHQVLVNHYMNVNVNKTHRATMLSIKNFFKELSVFILFPIVGTLTQNSGYTKSYSVLFGVLVVGMIVYYIHKRKS